MKVYTISKFGLAKLLNCVDQRGKVLSIRMRKLHLTDENIIAMGFETDYFKKKRVFGFPDSKKIIDFFQFEESELEEIKHL